MGVVRGWTWLLQLTDYKGGGVACSCRQRSTWLGPSARGSSNKDQPVRGTEQSTGHLLHTHLHTLCVFHTRTHSHAGVYICSPNAGMWSYIDPHMLQKTIPQHVNVNGNTHNNTWLYSEVSFIHHIIIFLQLFTRTVNTYLDAGLVTPTIIHIAIYGEVCVCEGRRKAEESVSWESLGGRGGSSLVRNNKKHIHERHREVSRSTSEGLNGQ